MCQIAKFKLIITMVVTTVLLTQVQCHRRVSESLERYEKTLAQRQMKMNAHRISIVVLTTLQINGRTTQDITIITRVDMIACTTKFILSPRKKFIMCSQFSNYSWVTMKRTQMVRVTAITATQPNHLAIISRQCRFKARKLRAFMQLITKAMKVLL